MNAEQKPTPKIKKKGPLRIEAILPFAIATGAIVFYFVTLFDLHLRKSIEWVGYKVNGAEVNVAQLKTSFLNGTFLLKGLELTDPMKPTHNSLQIGEIRFGVLWDGLLRARFVVSEMAVEQIQIDVPRKKVGKVAPPEPPPIQSSEPSAFEKEADKLKQKALNKVDDQVRGNAFAEAVKAMSAGSGAFSTLGEGWQSKMRSKALMSDFEKSLQESQGKLNSILTQLPQNEDIKKLSAKLSSIKTSGFSSPQDLQKSLDEFKSNLNEINALTQKFQAVESSVRQEMQGLENKYKGIEAAIREDIQKIESEMRLPKLDAQSIVKSLVMSSIEPYLARFYSYKKKIEPYIPPNMLNKDKKAEIEIKPHPRAKGVTYEFGKTKGYPLFWVQKVSISSKGNPNDGSGDVNGKITNITSNQALIGSPTEINIQGDFPSNEVRNFTLNGIIDNRGADSIVRLKCGIGSFPLAPKTLVQSPEVQLGYDSGVGQTSAIVELIGLKQLSYQVKNSYQKISYNLKAQNSDAQAILGRIFQGLPIVTLDIWGKAELPNFPLEIASNLGTELQKGFERELKKAIDEAKNKIQAEIQKILGEQKKKIDDQMNAARNQADGELKNARSQIDSQKAASENQANVARKDFEDQVNREKKRLEEEAKKALGNDGQKKLDDLIKKFGI